MCVTSFSFGKEKKGEKGNAARESMHGDITRGD